MPVSGIKAVMHHSPHKHLKKLQKQTEIQKLRWNELMTLKEQSEKKPPKVK